jgi:ribonuclease HI
VKKAGTAGDADAMVNHMVAVFADESCLGNGREGDNPGGAGALIEMRHPASGQLVRRDLWISEPATTNNRMALRSVIESMKAISVKGARCRVTFTTDSRYIVDGMTQWVHSWARNGWKRKGGAIENLALWQEALRAAAAHAVAWKWVRGHDGHAQNEYANHLATRAAADQSHSAGLAASEFETWLAATRARGARHADPSPFPEEAGFRAGSPLPSPDR